VIRAAELREVRAQGWSLTDEQLAAGIRSVAAPPRDGDGTVIAALNVTVHAAQTPLQTLTGEYCACWSKTAGAIGADWARYWSAPHVTVPPAGALTASTAASRLQVAGQVSGQRTPGYPQGKRPRTTDTPQ
jgi:hypothetical protein